jgi:hypothetical protein
MCSPLQALPEVKPHAHGIADKLHYAPAGVNILLTVTVFAERGTHVYKICALHMFMMKTRGDQIKQGARE